MIINNEDVTNLRLTIKYSPATNDRAFMSAEVLDLDEDNEYISFEFCGFIVKEFQEAKATLRLQPKRQGIFKFISLQFDVFNIPRRFDFDSIRSLNRNFNGEVTSYKGVRASWCAKH